MPEAHLLAVRRKCRKVFQAEIWTNAQSSAQVAACSSKMGALRRTTGGGTEISSTRRVWVENTSTTSKKNQQ
jgi:hypothetical protein